MKYAYVVRCSFEKDEPRQGFVKWLREKHVADVCRAGAESAEIVTLDNDNDNELSVEIRYRFESRESFATYERDHAPRLRAEGLEEAARQGVSPNKGITFARWTGNLEPISG